MSKNKWKATVTIKTYVLPFTFPQGLPKKKLEKYLKFQVIQSSWRMLSNKEYYINLRPLHWMTSTTLCCSTNYHQAKGFGESQPTLLNRKWYYFSFFMWFWSKLDLMHFFVYLEEELKVTAITLQFVNLSIKCSWGVIEKVFIKVGKFILLINFFFLDIKEYEMYH